MMFPTQTDSQATVTVTTTVTDYPGSEDGFREYLHDLGDEMFPFPGYRDYQDEILYEVLEAFFVDGYWNIVVEGPTGIGKSPLNVAVARVVTALNQRQGDVFDHFGVNLQGLNTGKEFYTTPQKSLRNQLAEDDDLREYVSMLKSRRDYTCGATGDNCQDCDIRFDSEESCMDTAGCTYWNEKMESIEHPIATITFAMLIIDNQLPIHTEDGRRLSYDDRDLVIVDEGHNSEGQSSSLFAGFPLSPWSLPIEVYGDAGEKVDWDADRFEQVEDLLSEIAVRAESYINRNENNPDKARRVEQCEDKLRKIRYAMATANEGKGWVCNVDESTIPGSNDMTKKIEVKPVRVDDFLSEFVWSRGRRRLVTSATIPFRDNISKWTKRIGLDGDTKFISKPTPFPEEHRLIHLNTVVGEMSGEDEDENWPEAMDQIREIQSHHEGEKGLIHAVSYPRAERVRDSLGAENVVLDEKDKETAAVITKWQNSDKDIIVSPTMMQGVDLFEDRCRWQVLLKVPYAYMGDSRVSYLLHEKHEWDWYMEEAAMDIIQAVGRAVRGPEPEEAASFYVIDEKFDDVMHRTTPPEYFGNAVRDDPPLHWDFPKTAPWR